MSISDLKNPALKLFFNSLEFLLMLFYAIVLFHKINLS